MLDGFYSQSSNCLLSSAATRVVSKSQGPEEQVNSILIGTHKKSSRLLIDELKLVNAINLDGGGSATLVLNGTLASYPSDHCKSDPQWRCARKVTTILCVHDLECEPTCVHGECDRGRCRCHDNFRGQRCEELFCRHHNCSNHGVCTPDGCICDPGWYRDDCTAPCGPEYFGVNCSQRCRCENNGSCDAKSGECSCLPGFLGTNCDRVCPVGSYGRDCASFCHCEESCHCDPATGVCVNVTEQISEEDSAMRVSQCIARKNGRKLDRGIEKTKSESFHWLALLCTTVGILALSLALNVFLILSHVRGVTEDCCATQQSSDGYLPLHNNEDRKTRSKNDKNATKLARRKPQKSTNHSSSKERNFEETALLSGRNFS